MKKLISIVLCIAVLASIVCLPVSAASGTLSREEELATDLKALGLFKGVSDTDFALDRAPTRVEALVMLIRVLGKESEALAKGGRHPFSDVPEWADKYVGYAYENNLTNGVSATEFGSQDNASAAMYITFVLRALGYSDTNGDFTWDNPYALARQTGVLDLKEGVSVLNFLRADVVLVSYAALEAKLKGSEVTLAEKLIEEGVFTKEKYEEVRTANGTSATESDDSASKTETKEDSLLRTWLEENSNFDELGAPTFAQRLELEGKELAFLISYFEEAEGFVVTYRYSFPNESETSRVITMMVFSAEGESTNLAYRYFEKEGDVEPLVQEQITMPKSDISEDMEVSFSTSSDNESDRVLHEAVANMLWYAGARAVDDLIKNQLSGSGLTGLSDFGFENFAK